MDTYLDRTWGAGWRRNTQGIKRVLADLARYEADPDALRERIHAETGSQE
jgi:hypothetical protein